MRGSIAQDVADKMEKQYGKNPNIFLLKVIIAIAQKDYLKAHAYFVDAINWRDKLFNYP